MRRPYLFALPRICAALSALIALSALSACNVGPDFATPPAPEASHFTPEKPASPGEGQRFAEDKDIPADWWTVFQSKPLDALVRESLENNPSLQAAEASVRVAYFNAEAQKGGFSPQIFFNSNDSTNLQSNNRALSTINQVI
jgi:outer membrane protein TolC